MDSGSQIIREPLAGVAPLDFKANLFGAVEYPALAFAGFAQFFGGLRHNFLAFGCGFGTVGAASESASRSELVTFAVGSVIARAPHFRRSSFSTEPAADCFLAHVRLRQTICQHCREFDLG